jgi:glycosyltransferase involved in cell wall biosynthesis
MRVAIYTSPLTALRKPTGVSQHAINMAARLAGVTTVHSTLLAARGDYRLAVSSLPESLQEAAVCFLPGPARFMRRLLLASPVPPVEHWCGEVDWVYAPREQPVPTRKARLAVTVHDVLAFEEDIPRLSAPANWRHQFRWRWIAARLLARADLILTVSEFTKSRLLACLKLSDPDRIVVVGNGASPTYYAAIDNADDVLPKYGLLGRPYLVAVGGLTDRKGGDLVIALAERLRRAGIEMDILMLGRRHDQQYLTRVAELNRERRPLPLRLAGYVPEPDLAALMARSVALVFPSRYEGFGIPAVEAMAAGTPVICSRAGALPEVVGDAGVYLNSESPDELLSMVTALADSPAARAARTAAGRSRAAHFTWDRCADRLLSALMGSRARRSPVVAAR